MTALPLLETRAVDFKSNTDSSNTVMTHPVFNELAPPERSARGFSRQRSGSPTGRRRLAAEVERVLKRSPFVIPSVSVRAIVDLGTLAVEYSDA